MGSYIGDLGQLLGSATVIPNHSTSREGSNSLDMTDFLTLMVAQFQNQSMDNTADTTDMLNQLVQMQVVEAITNITDATVTMYAGSLVGKEVTLGQFNSQGQLEELVGTVTGTGMSNGEQVIFVDGKSYKLSDIMAVGRLPEIEKPEGSKPEDRPEDEKPSDEPEDENSTELVI